MQLLFWSRSKGSLTGFSSESPQDERKTLNFLPRNFTVLFRYFLKLRNCKRIVFCIFCWKHDAISHQPFLNLGCFDTAAWREWYLPFYIMIATLSGIWDLSVSSTTSQNEHYSCLADNWCCSFYRQNIPCTCPQNIPYSEQASLIISHFPFHEWKMQFVNSFYYRCSQSET